MSHVNDLKMAALLIINNLPDGHIQDLEHNWLVADLGLAAGTNKDLNDLWYDYLVQEGATPAHINDMMEEWLVLSGYTGSVDDMLADMWADGPISANFIALAPANDGTFSVDPIKGTGTATFSRADAAYVRDHNNIYNLIPANVARIQGARYDGGVFYTELADGTPLHPTVRKEGVNVLARYATRVDSAAYAVGDNMIPATGSGPAGGNGYWYQVTAITTGTSGGSPPTFPETIGDTVVDGGITIENMGHYKLAGYLGEPAATNSILQSRQFDTTWVETGTPMNNANTAQDQNGINGVANVAWAIEDDSGATSELINQTVAMLDDGNTHCASIFILKDSDTSRFPAYRFRLSGGTLQEVYAQINTQTGAITDVASTGTTTSKVEDHGLWWRLILTVANNTTGNTSAIAYIYPANGTVFGTASAAATGTTIFDQAQLELNTSVPSSPITTTTVAVTRNADDLQYTGAGNIEESAGTILCSVGANWPEVPANARLVGNNTASAHLARGAAPNRVYAYDQTNFGLGNIEAAMALNAFVQAFARWSGIIMQSGTNGGSGVAGTYVGTFNVTDIHPLNENATSNFLQGTISDIRIYNTDLGQTTCEAATDYD